MVNNKFKFPDPVGKLIGTWSGFFDPVAEPSRLCSKPKRRDAASTNLDGHEYQGFKIQAAGCRFHKIRKSEFTTNIASNIDGKFGDSARQYCV